MTEKVKFAEQDESSINPPEASPVPTEQEIADLNAAYELLLRKIISVCKGNHPLIALSAVMSAAGCIVVDNISAEEDARKQLYHTFHAVVSKLPAAFKVRDRENTWRTDGNG